MRDHTNDPVIKESADKTIIAIRSLAKAASQEVSPNRRETPVQIVKQFIKMELDGKQLTSEGAKEIATLFVQPGSLRLESIDVVKEIGVGNASIRDENSAKVTTGSFRWGRLDPMTALFRLDPPTGEKSVEDYDLILTDAHHDLGVNVGTNGAMGWKISGPSRQPQISVETAIRYVTEMRNQASDAAIKQNAGSALAKLKSLH
jgi:hypothetical protein